MNVGDWQYLLSHQDVLVATAAHASRGVQRCTLETRTTSRHADRRLQ